MSNTNDTKKIPSNNSTRTSNSDKGFCVDNLFPTEIKSGKRRNKLDVNSLFNMSSFNNDPDITFTSDILIDRIKKRRIEKLRCYKNMLIHCHNKIKDVDDNGGTDLIFNILANMTECKDYKPNECIYYISVKLRDDDFDTFIMSDTSIFVTWKYIELKKEDNLKNNK